MCRLVTAILALTFVFSGKKKSHASSWKDRLVVERVCARFLQKPGSQFSVPTMNSSQRPVTPFQESQGQGELTKIQVHS